MSEIMEYPLTVKIDAAVVANNFPEFESRVSEYIDSINDSLETDEDFAMADQDVKTLKNLETRLANAGKNILMQVEAIAIIQTGIAKLQDRSSKKRLAMSKSVQTEKDRRKAEIVNAAIAKVATAASESVVKSHFTTDIKSINEAVKGKRAIVKMEEAVAAVVESELARLAEMETTANINLAAITEAEKEFPGLFHDRQMLAIKPTETVEAIIIGRVNDYRIKVKEIEDRKVAEEAEKKAKEEAERLEKEQKDKAAAISPPPIDVAPTVIPPPHVDDFTIPPPPPFDPVDTIGVSTPTEPIKYRLLITVKGNDIVSVLATIRADPRVISCVED
jgi:hypothetical protein